MQKTQEIFNVFVSNTTSNCIPFKDLANCLRTLGLSVTNDDLHQICMKYILNKTSNVDYDTFIEILEDLKPCQQVDSKLVDDAFQKLTADDSNLLISKSLLKSILTKYGHKMPIRDAECLLKLFDNDPDSVDASQVRKIFL